MRNAATYASEAITYSYNASRSATDAENAKDAAALSAVEASGSVTAASAQADRAEAAADDAEEYAYLAFKKADGIYRDASGSIVHIENGADGGRIKSLTAEVNPVQDLHGYDNPWPAGGGKNKLNPSVLETKTSGDVTFTPKSDAIVSLSGTSTGNINYYICPTGSNVVKSNAGYVLPAGTYTFSARKADGSPIGLGGAIGMFYWEGSSDTRQIVQLNNNNTISASGGNWF